jgi:hypothetical protein
MQRADVHRRGLRLPIEKFPVEARQWHEATSRAHERILPSCSRPMPATHPYPVATSPHNASTPETRAASSKGLILTCGFLAAFAPSYVEELSHDRFRNIPKGSLAWSVGMH